jgi:hypothetical protein
MVGPDVVGTVGARLDHGNSAVERLVAAALLAGLCLGVVRTGAAAILEVGPGRAYAAPSAAIAAAADGDTVAIDPGTYFDCAVVNRNRLAIVATGPDAVITDKACGGKALFVVAGRATVIRGLTFARARVPEGNGAGIRGEADDLTLEDCAFVNNQMGVMMAGSAGGTLRIVNSRFSDNGVAGLSDHLSSVVM